jgi:NADH-quinone oxidoreductase subunit C
MTTALRSEQVAGQITAAFPGADIKAEGTAVITAPDMVNKVCAFLKSAPGLEFDYLQNLTSVDYSDYFEVVYHITSLKNNQSMVLKTRCFDRNNAEVSSVTGVWRGADLQEREVFDLMGIRFTGHPNLKRLLLWDGFPGHPLRRDYL